MTIDPEGPVLDPRPHAEAIRRAVCEMAGRDAVGLLMRKIPVNLSLELDGWRVEIAVTQVTAGQE